MWRRLCSTAPLGARRRVAWVRRRRRRRRRRRHRRLVKRFRALWHRSLHRIVLGGVGEVQLLQRKSEGEHAAQPDERRNQAPLEVAVPRHELRRLILVHVSRAMMILLLGQVLQLLFCELWAQARMVLAQEEALHA